jgi:hypothetical protein
VFLGNDLVENLLPAYTYYPGPFVRPPDGGAGWEIVSTHIAGGRRAFLAAPACDGRTWRRMLRDLHAPTALARRAYGACEFLIGEADRLCTGVGTRLVVMSIPDPGHVRPTELARLVGPEAGAACDPEFPDKMLAKICEELDVRFVAGKRFLDSSHYKAIDPHWNEAGHRRVAEMLWQLATEPRSPDVVGGAGLRAPTDVLVATPAGMDGGLGAVVDRGAPSPTGSGVPWLSRLLRARPQPGERSSERERSSL